MRMSIFVRSAVAGFVAMAAWGGPHPAPAQEPAADPDPHSAALASLRWREIGPANMGGRTVDIAGIPGDPSTLFMATASGGLWRTEDGGTTWESVFEDGGTLSLGAVAVAPSDRSVVYLGTGENNPRNDASIGDGVYRSTDGGDGWTHVGLEHTEKIGRIRVDPRDPDVVFVAALGHEWGPNEERGVFRSRDGGASWTRVLYVNETTGAADLSMDPSNPRIVFAAMYDHLRQPWHFRSGGPGSGLYRSADGGATWTRLTDRALNNGLPTDTLGRIGVAVAPSNPDVVYAVIESKQGVLWRSDDGGSSWKRVSDERRVSSRPFYFSDIRVDPTDENTVYAVSGGLLRSIDGGRTWSRLAPNIHGDHQSLWIDPLDPRRLANGNDGGFHFSFDRGRTWELMNTVPLAQLYHVDADNRWPYRVCGGIQDNDVWCGPAATWTVTGPLVHDWYEIAGPGDGMSVQIDPRDPDIIYTTTQNGGVVRVDLKTGQRRSITPHPLAGGGQPAAARELRFNWNTPLLMSPHDPDVVFLGANKLFRTEDGGQSWTAVSPDLSRGDSTKLVSSGGVTPDNTGAEHYGTILTIAQSPLEAGVIWVGTDDGNVQVTRDGGTTWMNVANKIPGMPEEAWISHVEASRVDPGTAYVAVDRHRSDDPTPHVFVTRDFGAHWDDITGNLPSRHYVHVIREDPRNPDLLYVGTELGIWASWDGGGRWSSLRLNLPPVAVRDIEVHPRENDMIVATHGRSLWVLDDVTALQDLTRAEGRSAYLFPPRRAVRFRPWARRFRFDIGDRVFVGDNPPYGALVTYLLSDEAVAAAAAQDTALAQPTDSARVRLVIRDADGGVVRTLKGPAHAGVNRAVWDLRHTPLPDPHHKPAEGTFTLSMAGALAVPGSYTVSLIVGADTLSAPLNVILDPRHQLAAADLVEQRDALLRIQDVLRRGVRAVRRLDAVKKQVDALAERLKEVSAADSTGAAVEALETVSDSLAALRGELAPAGGRDFGGGSAALGELRAVARRIDAADARPTDAQSEWTDRLVSRLTGLLERADHLTGERVVALNRRLEEEGIPHVQVRR